MHMMLNGLVGAASATLTFECEFERHGIWGRDGKSCKPLPPRIVNGVFQFVNAVRRDHMTLRWIAEMPMSGRRPARGVLTLLKHGKQLAFLSYHPEGPGWTIGVSVASRTRFKRKLAPYRKGDLGLLNAITVINLFISEYARL